MNKQLAKDMKPYNDHMRKASKHLQEYITIFSIRIQIAARNHEDEYFWIKGKYGFGRIVYKYETTDNKTYKVIAWRLWRGVLVERKEVKEP